MVGGYDNVAGISSALREYFHVERHSQQIAIRNLEGLYFTQGERGLTFESLEPAPLAPASSKSLFEFEALPDHSHAGVKVGALKLSGGDIVYLMWRCTDFLHRNR